MASSLSSAVVRRPAIACLTLGAAAASLSPLVMPPAFAPPVPCAGLLEGLAALGAAILPSRPGAAIVQSLDAVTIGAAVGLFAWASWRLTGAAAASLIVAVAVFAHLASGPAYGLSAAAALAAACVALGHSVPGTGTNAAATGRAWLGTTMGLAGAAAISPPLSLPIAFAAGIVTLHACYGRRPPGLLAAATVSATLLVAGTGVLMAVAVPPLPGIPAPVCVLPGPSDVSLASLAAGLAAATDRLSPAVFALAMLGALATLPRWRRPATVPAAVLVLVPMAASLWPDPDAARTLALPVVSLWLFAAAGVARLLDAAGDRAVHRIALVLLMLMLPWLLWARGAPPSDEPDELGYARVTREDVAAMRLAMPRGASLVRDETVTEVLWRSLHDTRVTFVPADRLQVREALTAGPVYALPRTTRALGRVGIRFEPGGRLDPPGLARATAASLCTPVGAEPREMALPADAIGLTLVADAPDARGPIAVSAASDAPLRFARLDWPRSAERGFFTSGLDVSGAERLEIWRTPDAPRVLTVSVEGTPARLVIRSLTDDDEPLAVCAAFALPLRPLGPMER